MMILILWKINNNKKKVKKKKDKELIMWILIKY